MDEIVFVVEEDKVEGVYNAYSIGQSIFTFGKDENELLKNIYEAVACHFEDGKSPAIIRLQKAF